MAFSGSQGGVLKTDGQSAQLNKSEFHLVFIFGGFHANYNVPGWVTAIYCLNYYPSPWTRWNSESCFRAKPIKP